MSVRVRTLHCLASSQTQLDFLIPAIELPQLQDVDEPLRTNMLALLQGGDIGLSRNYTIVLLYQPIMWPCNEIPMPGIL